MKKIFLLATLAIGAVFAEPSCEAEKVQKLLEKMNSTLPQAIDEVTTGTKVECENAVLMYYFEINDDADSYFAKLPDAEKDEVKKEIQASHHSHFCKRMKPLHDDIAGIVWDYKYKSNGTDFLRDEMKMADCDK